ncbi:hypothetical protein V9T40_006931 [Parthenolecanium corni]|uniref:Reverse transcriptase domain-containing protein n=1 Tax=Parthenolecanium corni TaxID=536013 RepID=A0AAN9Y9Q2_9HEMI
MLSTSPFEAVHSESAAFLVRRDVKYSRIPLQSPNVVAIEIGDICLCSVYLSPNQDVDQTCEVLDQLLLTKRKVLAMGDLNCRLSGYTNLRQRPRDRTVQSLIVKHGLDILNSNTPTMDHNGTLGINDYTLARHCPVSNWEVLTHLESLSDHKYIRFEIEINTGAGITVDRTDAELLRQAITSTPPPHIEVLGAADCYRWAEEITNYLSEMLKSATAPKVIKPKVLWWNDDLEEIHRTIKRLRRSAWRTKSTATKKLIKELRLDFRNAIEKSKKEAWRQFVTTNTPWGKPYKVMVTPRRTQQVLLSDEVLLTSKFGNEPVLQEPYIPPEQIPPHHQDMEVSQAEIRMFLKKVKNRSAPGDDGINYKAIKLLNIAYPYLLPAIYSACLKFGVFPDCWKLGKVIWIPKPDKDPKQEGSYRPITLLSTLGKLLERCMNRRLLRHTLESDVLSRRQFGFLPRISTEDSVRNLLADIDSRRTHFNFTAVVSIDIKGAFDYIGWAHTLRELARWQFPEYLQCIVRDFLRNRVVKAGSCQVQLTRGCAQGSVLGGLLWNISYNYALEHFEPTSTRVTCYADDTAFVIGANNSRRLTEKINKLLEEVPVVLSQGGLLLSAGKTEVLVLRKKGCDSVPPIIRYTVEGLRRKSVRSIKYLGMMIDDRLLWGSHVRYLIEKSNVMLPKIVAVATNTFGYSNNARRIMLQGTIGAYFRYCSVIYSHALPAHRDGVVRLHREMVRCSGRLYRTVSYYPATAIANYPPLELDVYRTAIFQCWRKGYEWDRRQCLRLQFPLHELESRKSAMNAIEEQLLSVWQELYVTSGKGMWTQYLIPEVGVEIEGLDFDLAQALSGHGAFRAYLFKFKRSNTPLCECGEEETPNHVFRECHRHSCGRPASLVPLTSEVREYLRSTVAKLRQSERERERIVGRRVR